MRKGVQRKMVAESAFLAVVPLVPVLIPDFESLFEKPVIRTVAGKRAGGVQCDPGVTLVEGKNQRINPAVQGMTGPCAAGSFFFVQQGAGPDIKALPAAGRQGQRFSGDSEFRGKCVCLVRI